jgi:two-component system CheB/CheR fusion protein
VLSGADGDGAIGIKRIKERGGLTIAQDPDEAEHSGMPHAAIETGMVDWVLQVEQMPARLLDYMARERRLKLPPEDDPQPAEAPPPAPDEAETALRDVLALLRTRTARDFSHYKRATILRRISRRMRVCGLEDLPGYLAYLHTHLGETGALLQDLLISVTNFFRDRDAFEALEMHLPELFKGKGPGDTVRVWVAACATGEEAYSVAIQLCEYAHRLDAPPLIQVFATDLDENAIRMGREGIYPDVIAADVSEERLRRFFVKERHGYRVRREVREMVLFALQDLLKDSPFSRLDLIACRNLLIYLNRDAQARLFEIFHFALRPEGFLFLGSSESVEDDSPLFTALDKKHRIYGFRPAPGIGLPVPSGPGTLALMLKSQARTKDRPAIPPGVRLLDRTDSMSARARERDLSWSELHFKLIERLSPPSLVVNEKFEIMHLSEKAGQFLQFSGGVPSKSLSQIVHPMLRGELRAALYRAVQTHAVTEVFEAPVEIDGAGYAVNIRVMPADDLGPGYLLVVFDAHPSSDALANAAPSRVEPDSVVGHLERELDQMKMQLRYSSEQYETSTEELKASNEELQAMNEELRSATEELETSREELQSINEELTAVNQDLKGKVDELARANSDVNNLMAATAIATIFVDRDLRIMRYTPSAVALFNLIPSDTGRPLTDLKDRLDYPEMEQDATQVLNQLVPNEREVWAEGRCFLTRTLPYRAADQRITGAVLTFIDITARKEAVDSLQEAEAEQAVDLAAMRRLQKLSSRLHASQTLPALLEEILGAVIELQGADFGKVQLLDRNTGTLEIAALRGFKQEYIDYLKHAHVGDAPAYERALRQCKQIIVEDVNVDASYASLRDAAAQAGYRAVLATPLFDLAGDPLGVLSVHFRKPHRPEARALRLAEIYARQAADVIALKLSEQTLRESEGRFRAIVSQTTAGIGLADLNRRVTFVNQRLADMLGYRPEEMVGRLISELTHTDDIQENMRLIEQTVSPGIPVQFEKRFIHKNGSSVWVHVSVSPVRDAEGNVTSTVSAFLDITHHKETQKELLEALDRAEAATRAKDHFLAVLSHELRTPLTPVLMAAHTLARRTDLPPAVQESLAMIRRNVQLEARFIDDLLDLTHIVHGKIEILQEEVDVHEAIRLAVEISAPDMEAKGQLFEMALDAGQQHLLGDMKRLQQVFWNLLKNASKFSPQGAEIHLRSYNEPGRILITVADSGIGMEAGALQRIFHPFEQADESIARSFGGLGLGLAIARATVEAHGGQISATSAGLDQGSTFTISLPLA